MSPGAYRLVESARNGDLDRFLGRSRRVGLRGVLTDTNRLAERVDVPGEAAVGGIAWQRTDCRTRRWWPQGITTSADAFGVGTNAGTFEGQEVVLVSWYARSPLGRLLLGSRISVVADVDEESPVYRHVLLVEPIRRLGIGWLRPVRVHAGGIVWYRGYLYVAGGRRGVRVFRLDDIVRVRNRVRTKGYRYVLPQFTSYVADHEGDAGPMMYSFMSLDRAEEEDHLVVGEYGRRGGTHRLMRFPIDRNSQLLRADARGWVAPVELYERQIERMQGAALVEGTWVVTASMGIGRPGDLWVGHPGDYTRHKAVLPTGPEDITYWPRRRQLWSVTEFPQRRWVYAIDVDAWVRGTSGAD